MPAAQPTEYRLAIVGAGPAGLSSAARAAQIDAREGRRVPSYVLLEGSSKLAKTIQRYQKGKHVMAEPGFLELRSDLKFAAGSRESILETWGADASRLGVNVRYGAEVKKISGQRGAFLLQLGGGETIRAATVVLAIGLEGNPRRLGVPGEQCEEVQYQLDDPGEYLDETILVVGAGDAAIENALALSAQNDVWIVNRGKEFSRAKDANLSAVLAAISDPQRRLACYYETRPKAITHSSTAPRPLTVTLETPAGERIVQCHRIIARLGSDPARAFVESTGIRFPGPQREAIPALSREYESNVPGLYIVGSLAGYPLIKQAMNQGYDVAEYAYGNRIKPADYPLLEWQFCGLPFQRETEDLLERFKSIVPMFRELNALAFRELVIESEVIAAYPEGPEHAEARRKVDSVRQSIANKPGQPRVTRVIREGEVIYDTGEFGTSFFTIAYGEVTLQTSGPTPVTTQLKLGEFFGEMSLLSGRPRTERAIAGPGCILMETPRRTMIKLMSSNESVRNGIDWIFVVRELQRVFAPQASARELRDVAAQVSVRAFKAGELIFSEGEQGASLFIVRSGGVTLSRRRNAHDLMVAQVPAGQLVGEMSLMGDPQRRETARATVASELIEVQRQEFLRLSKRADAPLELLQRAASAHVAESARMEVRPEASSIMNFLMAQGLGEATNALIIDESLCIGCDNCEKACAETHGGIARLDRKAGASFAQVHVPISCRHCEQPHCMKDCPPNAIKRSANGEVFIDETCIGCGNCQVNCPYGVIRMTYEAPRKPGLLSWLLFGAGPGVGEDKDYEPTSTGKAKGKKATKCDACGGISNGPACVQACPTGAAIRVGPDQYLDLADQRRR
ncbi:MAG TPA: cyclic nucleotide-binding domain-containing protein [Steroidobacteraceae bacterium]|nr:cyclic nucleotide-binding domain-containing protein [Steroidobacteraceae bacterium]